MTITARLAVAALNPCRALTAAEERRVSTVIENSLPAATKVECGHEFVAGFGDSTTCLISLEYPMTANALQWAILTAAPSTEIPYLAHRIIDISTD